MFTLLGYEIVYAEAVYGIRGKSLKFIFDINTSNNA